jgi:hypothetical protein
MGNSQESSLRRSQLIAKYPVLATGHFRVTSPDDHTYNCLAFAAGETWRCWDPSEYACLYWPPGAPREYTLHAWIAAFEALGYQLCEEAEVVPGIEKVAFYGSGSTPLHAARQKESGKWVSKLGPREDIEHDLNGLEGDLYGRVIAILARPSGGQTTLAV